MNITEDDRIEHPVLDDLVSRWEATNGTAAVGFTEPYPYDESLALIRDLQRREPDRQWPPYRVTVAHQDAYFDLLASESYRAA